MATVDAEAALRAHMARKGLADFEFRDDLRMQRAIADGVLLEYLRKLVPFASWVRRVTGLGLAGLPPLDRPHPGPETEWLPAWKRRTIVFAREATVAANAEVGPRELQRLVDAVYDAVDRRLKQELILAACSEFLIAWRFLTVSIQLAPVTSSSKKDQFRHGLAYSLALYFSDRRLGPKTMALLMAALGRTDPIWIRSGESEVEAIDHRAENFKGLWEHYSQWARTAGQRLIELPAPPARNNRHLRAPVRSLCTGSWLAYRPEGVPVEASIRTRTRRGETVLEAQWREGAKPRTRSLGPIATQVPGTTSD